MATKYYFQTPQSEMCHPLSYFQNIYKKVLGKGQKIILYEAIPYSMPNIMWCKKFESAGDTGNCGKQCELYEPKNKKSGCCKHYSRTFYEPSNKPTEITI